MRPGLYLGQCAQYCGTQHAKMLLRVYVQTRDEFDRWIQEQSQPAQISGTVSEGQRIFERTACVNCHAVAGTAGKWALRSRSDPPDEPRHDCIRRGARTHRKICGAGFKIPRLQTRIQNAGHGIERSGTERSDRISGDSSLMSTESIAWPVSDSGAAPSGGAASPMGDHRRSQTAGHPVHPLCAAVSRDRGSGSDHHAHPAHSSA